MQVTKRQLFFIGMIPLVTSIMILLYILNVKDRGKALEMLPRFVVSDINGNLLNSADLLNKHTFVQIGDIKNRGDRTLLSKVVAAYGESLNIVMISDSTPSVDELSALGEVKIIAAASSDLRKLFNASGFGGFFLYNENGILIGTGSAYSDHDSSAKRIIEWKLLDKRFELEMIIPKRGNHISEYVWLRQIERLMVDYPCKYYLFCLFSSICDGCTSGGLVNLLGKIRAQAGEELGVWIILSPEFTYGDIEVLRTQLSLSLPIDLADSLLGGKWDELGKTYSMAEITEILFITNNNGRVIDVYSRQDTRSAEDFALKCLDLLMEK